MGAPLDHSIQRIRTSAERLNKVADDSAVVIAAAEKFLNEECSLGVYGSVEVCVTDISDGGGVFETTKLAYVHMGDRPRIVVQTYIAQDPESEHFKPWAECDRETKLETIPKLPALIEEVANQVDKKIDSANKAISTVGGMLKAFERKGVK